MLTLNTGDIILKVSERRVTKEDIVEAARLLDVEICDDPVKPGDLYLAGRNVGVKLLTAKTIHPNGWVVSKENAYPYDIGECVKIRIPKNV